MSLFPFLKDNIDYLDQHGLPAYTWLSNNDIDAEALTSRLFKNRWGMLDWRMEDGAGMFEALPTGPLYQEWTPKDKADTSATIIVGGNLGYGINHVLAHTPDSHKVVLVEPDPLLLTALLGQTDYRPFFANRKLHIAPPDEMYLNHLIKHLDLQFIYGRIHLRADIPSTQLGPDYARFTRILRDRLENFSVELQTLRFRQDVMVGNELKNFRRALADGSLKDLKGAGKGMGAVIIGAGPSLAEMGPALAEDQGDMLYTTALQSMPAVQAVGIKPDLCLAIDYDPSMLRVYDRLDPEWAADVPLIYSTKVQPEVVERYPGPTIPLWTMGGMATFAMQDRELVLDAGGNVGLTLSRLMTFFEVSHVVLVGQDFSWKGKKSHAAGHHAAKNDVMHNPKRHVQMTNLDGETIHTSVQYNTSRRELEDDLAKAPYPVFNLYGGGVDIKGTAPVSLEDLRTKDVLRSAPGAKAEFMERLHAARARGREFTFEPRSHRWSASLRNAEKKAAKLFKHLARNQEAIHEHMEYTLIFLKQDPLYLPYLFNETMNMAGLAKARHHYEPKDLAEYKRILKQALAKVREADRLILHDGARVA